MEYSFMKVGAFTFVLHSHIPYCRSTFSPHSSLYKGWPHGEEWLHEAVLGTYLPLLIALYELRQENRPFKLTLSLTPVLVEQLADSLVIEHCEEFLEDKMQRAQSDVKRFEKAGERHLSYLAHFYLDRYQRILFAFKDTFDMNIVLAFRRLQDEGYVEITTSAATHAYLPLLERDSSVYAQLKTGFETYRRHFRISPRSVWLPECGYRPAFYIGNEGKTYVKPGIEHFLSELGISCFFAETHTVEGGQPVGKAREEVIGPYGNIPRRYAVPLTGYIEPTQKTTYLPYWVQTPEVAVIGRNNRTGMQVWSAEWGYPGDFHYREFHKKDGISGLQYWKITGTKVELGQKEYYDPYWAAQRVEEHSSHYSRLVEELLINFYQETGKFGIIAAAYDTELFGHWWFEGVDWIKQVLRHLGESEVVQLTTASEYIGRHPPEDVLALPEGSWGLGGGHFTWQNVDNEWMLPIVHSAELKMEEVVVRYPNANGVLRQILNQAARELLLLQSSDWAFLITTGQAREYAELRFKEHVGKFYKLLHLVESRHLDENAQSLCKQFWEEDKLFPDIDYHYFKNREQNSGR